MELKNKIKIVLNKINRHGRENIAAAVILKIFIGIGFFVVLWLLRSYSADFCLRTLEQKAEEPRGIFTYNFRPFRTIWKCLPIS